MVNVKKKKIRGKYVWLADYSCSRNGKLLIRKRKIVKTKKEGEEWIEEQKSLYENNINKFSDCESLIKKKYYDFAEASYDNKDTKTSVISKYNNYLSNFYLDNNLSFITKDSMVQLRSYISNLKDKNGNDISLTLKESIWQKNKTFINWLIDREDIPAFNYFVRLKRFCDLHKSHVKKRWEIEEFNRFIEVVDDFTEKTYFVGLFTLGTRKSELNNLKFSDVNEISRNFSIRHQYKDKTHGETALKTEDSNRDVPMSDLFIKMVNVLKKRYLNMGIPEDEIDNMYVFLNDKGNVIPRETLRRHFKKYIEKAGLPEIRIHDLRGSFASRMLDETGNLELVRQLLGHADVRTTMVYITPGKKKFDEIRKLNELEGIEIIDSDEKEK